VKIDATSAGEEAMEVLVGHYGTRRIPFALN